VEEVGPTAISLKQYIGPRRQPGETFKLPGGSVVLKAHTGSFDKKATYVVCVLLPNGEWHTAADCAPPNCGQLLRDRTRTWLSLSLESRVIRAISELIEELNLEVDVYLDHDTAHTLEDDFVCAQLEKIEELANLAATSTGKQIINEETIFEEFQRWLEAIAVRTLIEPEKLYNMLIRGAQRAKTPHVDYLKRFNRAIRFQDKENE
jgi:hypothetical protein